MESRRKIKATIEGRRVINAGAQSESVADDNFEAQMDRK